MTVGPDEIERLAALLRDTFGNGGAASSPSDAEIATTSVGAERWRVQKWPEFRDTSPEQHRWLIEGLLPEGALVFVAGPPKKGKTWLGIALALAVATKTPLFGAYVVPEARDVLYVALEGSRVGLRARIGALTRGLGLDPDSDALDRLHMLYRPRPFDLVDGSADSDFATAAALIAAASDVEAALVIIDVLRAAARFKENEQAEFAKVRDAIEPLLTAGRSVPVLHHFGKLTDTQQQRSPGERMAGTGAMYGALDVGFLITKSESGARRLRVEIEARDFAAPDALGVVITGNGTGEHGGFTYADTATIEIDPTATEERELVPEIEALFVDGVWRIVKEIAGKQGGIGANLDDVRAALSDAPDRFASVDGPRIGRHPNAKPWGTLAMLQRLTSTPESHESDASEVQQSLSVDTCDSPYGGDTSSHTYDRQPTVAPESDDRSSQTPGGSTPSDDEIERLADLARDSQDNEGGTP